MPAKVLIVEDENIVAEYIADTLRRSGYELAGIADSGEAAIQSAESGQPDVVLMDIRLKGPMDGIEAAARIHDAWRTPVVYLTAYGDESTLQRAQVAEPYAFLVKPFQERDLRNAIEVALRRHALEQRLRESEAKLRESEAHYRLLAENAGDIIALSGDGTIHYISPACARLLGYEPEQLVGRPGTDLLYPPDWEALLQGHERAVATYRARRADGSYVWLESALREVPSSSGGRQLLLSVTRDVTEREQALAALRRSEERYRLFVEQSLAGIWCFEAAPVSVDAPVPEQVQAIIERAWLAEANDAFARMYGHDRAEDLKGAPLTQFLDPQDPQTQTLVESFVRGGYRLEDAEATQRARDGSTRIFLNYVAGTVEDRHLLRAWGIQVDVTELRAAQREAALWSKELERRVQEQTRSLRETNQSLESFAQTVSHDLRAPLRGVAAYLDVLMEDHARELTPGARAAVASARAETERMRHLVEGLLALSRARRASLTIRPVDLSAMAREIASGLRANDPGRDVVVTLAPGLNVEGDEALLRAALTNLLGNAWKYTLGRLHPRIEVGALGNDTYYVRDNGVGFDMAQAERLFQPFQRLHSDRGFVGTGVGLATVKSIIERHGGRVWVEAKAGEGATFFFTLPRRGEPQDGAR